MKLKLTDRQILKGLKANEDDAIKALLLHHTPALKRYVLKNGGDIHEANDIEQRAIVVLYEKSISNSFELNDGVKLSTFVFSIGKNLWYKELRKKKKVVLGQDEFTSNKMSIVVEDIELESRDKQETLLLKALDRLDLICLQLLKGKYYQKMSDQEISLQIGSISIENIRKRRYKCIKKLKKIFLNLTDENG